MPDFDVPRAVKLAQAITFLGLMGRHADAMKRMPELLAIAPNWHLAHVTHAHVLFEIERREEALVAAGRGVACEPTDVHALRLVADILYALDRNDEAWTQIERAILANPNAARSHFVRAKIARALGRPDEAMRSLHAAIALQPDEPDYFLMLVEMLDWRAHPEAARAQLREILALDPLDARVFYRLAQIALEQREFDDAEFWLAETLRQDPTHKKASSVMSTLKKTGPMVGKPGVVGEMARALRTGVAELHRRRLPPAERTLSLDALGDLIAAHARFVAALAPGVELNWERSELANRKFEYFREGDVARLGDQLVLREYVIDGLEIPSANLTYANLSLVTLKHTTFTQCRFERALAVNLDAERTRFVDCDLQRVDFSDSRLTGCAFVRGNGTRLDFERVQFVDCEFDGITLDEASFLDATLTRCTFRGVKAATLTLTNEQLRNCTFVD